MNVIKIVAVAVFVLVLVQGTGAAAIGEREKGRELVASKSGGTITAETPTQTVTIDATYVYRNGNLVKWPNPDVSTALEKAADNSELKQYKYGYTWTAGGSGDIGMLLNVTSTGDLFLSSPGNASDRIIAEGAQIGFDDALGEGWSVNITDKKYGYHVLIHRDGVSGGEVVTIDPTITQEVSVLTYGGSMTQFYDQQEDTYHVAFSNGTSNTELWYANSTDGINWNFEHVFSETAEVRVGFIFLDSNNVVHIGFKDMDGSFGRATLKYIEGINSAPVTIETSQRNIVAVIDENDVVHMYYGQGDSGNNNHYVNDSLGTINQNDVQIDSTPGGNGDIAIADDGTIHVSWFNSAVGEDRDGFYANSSTGFQRILYQDGETSNSHLVLNQEQEPIISYFNTTSGTYHVSRDFGQTETQYGTEQAGALQWNRDAGHLVVYYLEGNTLKFESQDLTYTIFSNVSTARTTVPFISEDGGGVLSNNSPISYTDSIRGTLYFNTTALLQEEHPYVFTNITSAVAEGVPAPKGYWLSEPVGANAFSNAVDELSYIVNIEDQETVTVTVEASDNNFVSVKDTFTLALTDGMNTENIEGDIVDAAYYRFRVNMSAVNETTPEMSQLNVTGESKSLEGGTTAGPLTEGIRWLVFLLSVLVIGAWIHSMANED